MLRTILLGVPAWVLVAALGLAGGCRHVPEKRADITNMQIYVLVRTTAGEFVLELDPVRAPVTTSNFLAHARAGHYDGTIFHRVVPGFVVQGGGWTPDLRERAKADAAAGSPDVPIRNEWQNGLRNERGTIGMARDEQPDTATREFYFNLTDNFKLDTPRATTGNAGYAVFGHVLAGWEVIERISAAKTAPRPETGVTDGSMNNVPIEPVQITRVEQIEADEARLRVPPQ
ncbi:MAG: peptidylprolyl isomerase [Phycisphaerales bacterium]